MNPSRFHAEAHSVIPNDFDKRRYYDSMQGRIAFGSSFGSADSISPGALSIETSRDMRAYGRRNSTVSPTVPSFTDSFGTPCPITPMHGSSECWPTPSFLPMSSFSSTSFQAIDGSRIECSMEEVGMWMDECGSINVPSNDAKRFGSDFLFTRSDSGLPRFSGLMYNPVLAPDIFSDASETVTETSHSENIDWNSQTWSTPQTVAPTATQAMLSSSPMPKAEPSTPIQLSSDTMSYLASSPIIEISPVRLPSQILLSDSYSDIEKEVLNHRRTIRTRGVRQRLECRSYERKNLVSNFQKPRNANSKSNVEYEAFIPQNAFACSFPDCIDRATGKQKRFKRREHCKRHEKTVHNKADAKLYPCWVEGCTTNAFSRRDNLNMHFKTHTKNTPAHRNRYVATLDETSEFYDADWQGPLTSDGFPIREGVTTNLCGDNGCQERFYTADGWQKHISKEHRDSHSSERQHCRNNVSLKSGSKKNLHASSHAGVNRRLVD